MTNTEFLRNRLLARAGLAEPPKPPFQGVTFEQLRASEWSPEFETLMRNRLAMGALRYGRMNHSGKAAKPKYDRIGSVEKRLRKYTETGNTEFLVDSANLLLMEFVECHHPNAHFRAVDEHDDRVKRHTISEQPKPKE